MTTTVVRRLYFYAAAFIGLQLLAGGARALLSVLLSQAFAPAVPGSAEFVVVQLSASAALVLVGLPLWAFHWWVVQRAARERPEEQHALLRRLYGYAALLVAVLNMLFALRGLLGLLLGGPALADAGEQLAAEIAGLAAYTPLWIYHWRVLAADRSVVEVAGGAATLRRWYLAITLAVSLSMAAYAAIDLLHLLLRLWLAPALGEPGGVGWAVATMTAGLAAWLPHQLWALALIVTPAPAQASEQRSTLRQVYLALVITSAAIAGLGGLAALLYAVLLAAFGGASWATLLADNTQPLALALVAPLLWEYHRRQLAREAQRSAQAERGATARRLIGYLMAAVGLGALYFGLAGLLGTLLRMLLAPELLGAAWREPLSLFLALALVALPVYWLAAQANERRARASATEEHTLIRRVYLYAGLLFGLIAAVVTAVLLLRLLIRALLGAGEPYLAPEAGRWLGYTLVGAVIAAYHIVLVRRAGAARGEALSSLRVAILADEPLRPALLAACARELPGAALLAAGTTDIAPALAALAAADALIAPLAAALDGPLASAIRSFQGRRLLLATAAPGYELIGAREGTAALARHAAQALRATPGLAQQPGAPPAPPLAQGVG